MTALFLSDIQLLAKSIQNDFPDIVKLSSIGNSFEGREIQLLTVDARDKLAAKADGKLNVKPAILLTG